VGRLWHFELNIVHTEQDSVPAINIVACEQQFLGFCLQPLQHLRRIVVAVSDANNLFPSGFIGARESDSAIVVFHNLRFIEHHVFDLCHSLATLHVR